MTANQIAYWGLQETKRSNQAREKETNRSNRANETETNRHNLVMESLQLSQNQETGRHNLVTEAVQQSNLQELVRSNQASETIRTESNAISKYATDMQAINVAKQVALGYSQLSEQHRANVANETQQKFNLLELSRHQTSTEAETERTNKAKENLQNIQAIASLRSSTASQQQAFTSWNAYNETVENNLRNYGMRKAELVEKSVNDLWKNSNDSVGKLSELVSKLPRLMILGG